MTPCFRCWLCKHVDASPLTVENGSAQPAAPLPTAPASRPTAGPVGMWLGSALPEGERGMADGGGGDDNVSRSLRRFGHCWAGRKQP